MDTLPVDYLNYSPRSFMVVITTAQFHLAKLERKFWAGSNPVRGLSRLAMVRSTATVPGRK